MGEPQQNTAQPSILGMVNSKRQTNRRILPTVRPISYFPRSGLRAYRRHLPRISEESSGIARRFSVYTPDYYMETLKN